MRIMFVHSYGLEGSGSSIYTRSLVHTLLNAGHEVALAAYRCPNDDWALDELEAAGCRFITLDPSHLTVTYHRAEFPGAPLVSELTDDQVEKYRYELSVALSGAATLFYPDLVISNHLLISSSAAVAAARVMRVPAVVISHGTDIIYGAQRSPIIRNLSRRVCLQASAVVTLNKSARNQVSRALHLPESQLAVVPPGIQAQHLVPLPRGDRPNRIALVGRMLLDKGVHLLIAALGDLLPKHPDLHVRLIGDGPDRQHFMRLVQALDNGDLNELKHVLSDMRTGVERIRHIEPVLQALAGRRGARRRLALEGRIARAVSFSGYVKTKQVIAELRSSRLLVLPSMVPECFPLTILEGMAAGCSVALSPLGGSRSVIDWISAMGLDTYCAELDMGNAVSDLAAAVDAQLSRWTPGSAEAMQGAVAETYEWSAVANDLLAVVDVPITRKPVALLSTSPSWAPMNESANA